MKKIPLTAQQFALINVSTNWNDIQEIPMAVWNDTQAAWMHRRQDAFAVMASGCKSEPIALNGISDVILGMDVLTVEPRPHVNEPFGNAYHLLVVRNEHLAFPYLVIKYFKNQTVVGHWFDYLDLDRYWNKRSVLPSFR